MTLLIEQRFDADRMMGVHNAADPVRLRSKLVRLTSGWPVMVLPLPAGLAGRGSRPVTLYTPDSPQQRARDADGGGWAGAGVGWGFARTFLVRRPALD